MYKTRAHKENTEYKTKLAEWQAQDHQRVELNKARWVAHKLAINEWNEAKKAAKLAKIVFNVPKPILEIIKKAPKPAKVRVLEEEGETFAQEIAGVCSSEDNSNGE